MPAAGGPAEIPIQERLAERLARARLQGDGPLVLFLIATDGAPSRAWPWQSWVTVAQALRRAVPGLRLAIVTSVEDLWPAVRIHEETGRIHPALGPDLDPGLRRALFAAASLAVGSDNADLALAAELGTATVGLYGPTDPRRRGPSPSASAGRHTALAHPRWCSPCGLRHCLLVRRRCLRDLDPENVVAACAGRLGQRPSPTTDR